MSKHNHTPAQNQDPEPLTDDEMREYLDQDLSLEQLDDELADDSASFCTGFFEAQLAYAKSPQGRANKRNQTRLKKRTRASYAGGRK